MELFAAGPTLYRLETGRNAASFESVCDILAGIEPSLKPALNQLEPELFRDVARIGGAVVLEVIFALPGMGMAIVSGVTSNYVMLVQGVVLVVAITFIIVNVIVDMLYILIDPRIRTV